MGRRVAWRVSPPRWPLPGFPMRRGSVISPPADLGRRADHACLRAARRLSRRGGPRRNALPRTRGPELRGDTAEGIRPDVVEASWSAARSLAAEFPTEAQARTVLGAIGRGERTFTLIGRAAGGLNPRSVSRSLELLTSRRMVAAELPLSTKPSRETRYRIDDPYLRFWLSFIGPGIPAIERGRGDRVLDTIRAGWTSWRGRAIEPVVREALWRLGSDDGQLPAGPDAIGGYWPRTNDPEIDIVGADRAPIAKKITLVGSVKWLEKKPFDNRDLARLIPHRSQLPGADDTTPLLAVTRPCGRSSRRRPRLGQRRSDVHPPVGAAGCPLPRTLPPGWKVTRPRREQPVGSARLHRPRGPRRTGGGHGDHKVVRPTRIRAPGSRHARRALGPRRISAEGLFHD